MYYNYVQFVYIYIYIYICIIPFAIFISKASTLIQKIMKLAWSQCFCTLTGSTSIVVCFGIPFLMNYFYFLDIINQGKLIHILFLMFPNTWSYRKFASGEWTCTRTQIDTGRFVNSTISVTEVDCFVCQRLRQKES